MLDLGHFLPQMNEMVDSVNLSHAKPSVLIQPLAVFLWHAITEKNVERDDSHFVFPTAHRKQGRVSCAANQGNHCSTYLTDRSSRSGTISSTRVLGALPSADMPVAQLCARDMC